MYAQTIRKTAAITILLVLATSGLSIRPSHASTPPPWTVSLDANSISNTDADIQTTNNISGASFITVGAVLNASTTHPVNGVYGWQFSIIYDNTTLRPVQLQFGAQTGLGHPNWATQVSQQHGFGNNSTNPVSAATCSCDPATHKKETVYFSFLAPFGPVDIDPYISTTVQGNLLANVRFALLAPINSPVTLTPAEVTFLDQNLNQLPNINPGAAIQEKSDWTVRLDANNIGPTDTSIQNSNSPQASITIGAVIDASSSHPLNNVTAWQLAVTYNSTVIRPIMIGYGSQSGPGNPDWASLITSNTAQGHNFTQTIDAANQKVFINFTLNNRNPSFTVAPSLSQNIQGNLLATINFKVLNNQTQTLTLTPSDIAFYDNSTQPQPIPNITSGPPITEMLYLPPPGPSTDQAYIIIGITIAIIAALFSLAFLRMRRKKTSSRLPRRPQTR